MSGGDAFAGMKLLGAGAGFRKVLADLIDGCNAFPELEWRELEMLAGFLEAYEAEPGAVVFREGDAGTFMCILIAGAAEIVKQDSSHGEKRIGEAGPGKTIGEMALVDGEPRSATCVCSRASTLAVLTRESFMRLMRAHPALSSKLLLKLLTLVSRRLRLASGQLVDYLEDR